MLGLSGPAKIKNQSNERIKTMSDFNTTKTTRRDFLNTTAALSAGGLLLSTANIASAQDTSAVAAKPLKSTKTEQNLLKAFAGESQARNRYTFFADQARADGFQQIAAIFEETAAQEMVHAKRFFSQLQGGNLDIQAGFPAGVIGDTEANLLAAAEGEHEEWSVVYPEFAKIAAEEGFPNIAQLFQSVANAEQMHERRYRDFLKNVREDLVFERDERVIWTCRNCGYTHAGREPIAHCPACAVSQAYFQLFIPTW